MKWRGLAVEAVRAVAARCRQRLAEMCSEVRDLAAGVSGEFQDFVESADLAGLAEQRFAIQVFGQSGEIGRGLQAAIAVADTFDFQFQPLFFGAVVECSDDAVAWLIQRGRGFWKDRTDIGDGLEYQRAIREDRTPYDEL